MPYRSPSRTATDDLLDILIGEEDSPYPWDIAGATASDAAEEPSAFSLFEDWQEEELTDRADHFFTNLQQRWDEIESPSPKLPSIGKFTALVPEDYLTRLVEQAEALVHQPLDALDRLVACIGPLFPRWSEEDLQVFARPYALAMRDTTAGEIPGPRDWQTRSEIEQIRLCAAIASQISRDLEAS